jgi:hypothetical protein
MVNCEDGRFVELTQKRVQWQALILAVLNQTLIGDSGSRGAVKLALERPSETACTMAPSYFLWLSFTQHFCGSLTLRE